MKMCMRHAAVLLMAVVHFATQLSCSGEVASPPANVPGAPMADVLDPIAGIADPGDDPAVVSIEADGQMLCAAALVAPDVVLTSLGCLASAAAPSSSVSSGSSDAAPASSCTLLPLGALREPTSLGVRVGDTEATAERRARGRAVILPPESASCGAEVALVLLDQVIDDIQPLVVRTTGVARGDHVRTVGFGRRAGPLVKVVRDHLGVVATTATEILVRETACESGCGDPVIDEASGDLVGIVWGTLADATPGVTGDVGLRADAFLAVIEGAIAQGAPVASGTKAKEKKGAIDVGDNCSVAADCAAGVCVTDGARRYCSRTCATGDRCPANFRCVRCVGPEGPVSACVESRFARPSLRGRPHADNVRIRLG